MLEIPNKYIRKKYMSTYQNSKGNIIRISVF